MELFLVTFMDSHNEPIDLEQYRNIYLTLTVAFFIYLSGLFYCAFFCLYRTIHLDDLYVI